MISRNLGLFFSLQQLDVTLHSKTIISLGMRLNVVNYGHKNKLKVDLDINTYSKKITKKPKQGVGD